MTAVSDALNAVVRAVRADVHDLRTSVLPRITAHVTETHVTAFFADTGAPRPLLPTLQIGVAAIERALAEIDHGTDALLELMATLPDPPQVPGQERTVKPVDAPQDDTLPKLLKHLNDRVDSLKRGYREDDVADASVDEIYSLTREFEDTCRPAYDDPSSISDVIAGELASHAEYLQAITGALQQRMWRLRVVERQLHEDLQPHRLFTSEDVTALMRSGGWLRGCDDRSVQDPLWEQCVRLRDAGLSVAQVATWLDGYLWEPYDPEHLDNHNKHHEPVRTIDGTFKGSVETDPEYYIERGATVSGQATDTTVLARAVRRDIPGDTRTLAIGSRIKMTGGNYLRVTEIVGCDETAVEVRGPSGRTLTIAHGTKFFVEAPTELRHIEICELERAVRRYRLAYEDRFDELAGHVDVAVVDGPPA